MFHRSFTRRSLTLAASLCATAGALAVVGCHDSNNGSSSFPAPVQSTTGDSYVLTSSGRLLAFNRQSPSQINSSTTVALTGIVGGDARPSTGKFYVLTNSSTAGASLSIVDPGTGAVSSTVKLVAATGDAYTALSGTRFEVDFNPVVDRLRIVSDNGQNLRVNVDTGAVTTDAAINGGTSNKLLGAAYTNDVTDACATMLKVIGTDGNLYTQTPANNGTLTSPLPTGLTFAAGDAVKFDIYSAPSTRGDSAYLIQNSTLYGVDLTAGTAGLIGTLPLNTGETVTAFFTNITTLNTAGDSTSVPSVQQGALAAIVGTNVVSFNAANPQKLCSTKAITAAATNGLTLASGETVIGTDFRPSDSKIYGLTSAARVFTLAPYTGVATVFATLTADTTDTTDAYTATKDLPTTANYGVDFNPVADKLRVVGSNGSNLRITLTAAVAATAATSTTPATAATPASATVITDTRIATTNAITASAYTNSAPTSTAANTTTPVPTATVLYDIDTSSTTSSTLYTQNPPNDGTLTAVGSLGVAGGALNGFEIVSTRSSTDATVQTDAAYAGLTVGGSTSLYTVNLGTGAATLVNTISDGKTAISGLTRAK